MLVFIWWYLSTNTTIYFTFNKTQQEASIPPCHSLIDLMQHTALHDKDSDISMHTFLICFLFILTTCRYTNHIMKMDVVNLWNVGGALQLPCITLLTYVPKIVENTVLLTSSSSAQTYSYASARTYTSPWPHLPRLYLGLLRTSHPWWCCHSVAWHWLQFIIVCLSWRCTLVVQPARSDAPSTISCQHSGSVICRIVAARVWRKWVVGGCISYQDQ